MELTHPNYSLSNAIICLGFDLIALTIQAEIIVVFNELPSLLNAGKIKTQLWKKHGGNYTINGRSDSDNLPNGSD